jgi:hypothetical protein
VWYFGKSQSRWSCGQKHRSDDPWLLGLRVRIPQGEWMFVACVCCVLSGRGLCDGLITRTEESCRVCVCVCLTVRDLETPTMKWSRPIWTVAQQEKKLGISIFVINKKLPNSMGHSPSWESNRFSASQEIPRNFWNPQVHYWIHNNPPPVPILIKKNPVHTLHPAF